MSKMVPNTYLGATSVFISEELVGTLTLLVVSGTSSILTINKTLFCLEGL